MLQVKGLGKWCISFLKYFLLDIVWQRWPEPKATISNPKSRRPPGFQTALTAIVI
jgi:hypothetical protein